MGLWATIIAFFEKLFGVKETDMTDETTPKFKVGDRVVFDDPTIGRRVDNITAVDTTVDPTSPYTIKFDDSEVEEGTYGDGDLRSA